MSFIKKQSIHQRKIGDKSFILTADGNIEIELDTSATPTKGVSILGNLTVSGNTSGPKVSNVYYVTEDGSDLNDGQSADKNGAFASIKKASEIAPSGSTIIVAPGDYYENNPITLRDFVTVTGQGELRNTRVFPKNNTQTIFYLGNGCYLYQITFRGLRSPGWCAEIRPGTLCTTSPYVQNCTNFNGPWLNDGTEFIPFETVQIDGIEPSARPLLLSDYPSLPEAKQINDTGGGGGIYVDGDAYDPASLVFSFVADAFTQIAQGGIGFWVDNFGYTQIVSCFSVFCSTGFLTTRGGYLSISNSVSDFGTYGCVADGFYPVAYTNAVSDENYYSTVGSITIVTPGVGYTTLPTVVFDAPSGAGGVTAIGTAQIDVTTGQLSAVTIDNAGSGYTSIPLVTFTGGGATIQATAKVNLTTNSAITLSSLRDKPQTGSVVSFEGDPTYYYITSTVINTPPFVYNETVCRRDVRRIVDAVVGDIVMGTNYQSITAAQSYLRSTAAKVILDQLEPTIYALEATRDLMKAETSSLAMKEEIDQRFNIITSVLSAGDSTGIPDIIYNDLSSIDEGYINAKDNVVANRDFIIAELTSYINDQFTELSYNQTQYTTDMSNFTKGLAMYAVLGSNQQVVRQAQEFDVRVRFKSMMLSSLAYLKGKFLGLGDVAASGVATANVTEGFNTFTNIYDDGDSAGIVTIFPEHVGVEVNRADAKDQLQANKELIKAEFVAYLADANPIFEFDAEVYKQDMEYVVDALTFDILYGGDSSVTQEAIYYFNNKNGFANLLATEKASLVDAFARVRFIVQRIVRGLPVTNTTGNVETQDFSSGDASQTEATYLDALVQIIEDSIDNATITGLVKTYPIYDSEPALQQAAAGTILSQSTTFIADAITYNLTNNPTLTYNTDKCARDVGYIIDAIYRDAQLGTNVNSITAALAYTRANTAYLNVEQKPATIIAMRYAKTLLVEAASRNATFQTSVSDLFDDILNIIEFDQLPSEGLLYPEPGPASQNLINATNQVLANKDFLKAELVAYINDNNFVYDQAKCERDTGLIIDAAYYDAALGTNYNAVVAGLAYQRAYSSVVITDQLTETVGAITFAKGEAQTAAAGDATAQTRVGAAFDEVLDIIQNGVVSTETSADARVFPNPSTATTAQINAKEQLQANRTFLAKEAVAYVQNNYQNFIYNQAKCERDIGLIMDAVALDIPLGTNYNSVTAGLAYQRASSADLQDDQLLQTVGAITELKKEIIKLGLSDAAEPLANAAINEILDILQNGVLSTDTAADALVFPTPAALPTANAVEAKDQLIANKAFIIAEVTAWIAVNYPALSYDVAKCERDVGYIVDALTYDVLYGGNLASKVAAESYFVGAVGQLGAGESVATAAAYNRLGQVVGDVVIEGIVEKSSGYAETQDTSGAPASSTEVDDLSGLVQIIEDVVLAGSISGMPSTVMPSIAWADNDLEEAYNVIKGNKTFVQDNVIIWIANNFQSFVYDEVKCARDVGIMVEAVAYDAVFNTNYNSVTAGLAYQRANASVAIGSQNLQTVKAIEYVQSQVQLLSISSQTKSRANAGFNEILDIINNGVVSTNTSADALVFTSPVGVDNNKLQAKNELQLNRAFLQAEITAWIAVNYPALSYDVAKCERDVGYIVDALTYDVLYGGNLASKVAAESYFVGAVGQLGAGESVATAAAFAQLKSLVGSVVQNIAVGAPSQVLVTQDISGTGSDAGTAGEVQDRVQIIVDVITAGSISSIPADSAPVITGQSATEQADFAVLDANSTSIQEATITYINNTFTRNFTFDSTKCERDTKYIIDALTYDILYGGNSASSDIASSYYYATISQVEGQGKETAAALEWIDTLLGSVLLDTVYADPEQTGTVQDTTAGIASATEVTRVDELLQIFQNVIVNGTDNLPTVTYPNITWATAGIQGAVADLNSAKTTIIDDTITFIGTTYNGFSYDQAICARDTGYLIDAVAHDTLYEGNIATLIATRAYFLGAVAYIPEAQRLNTVAAYEHLATVAANCIEGIAVSPTAGNSESQVLSGSYGTSTESTISTILFNITKTAINNGNLVGTPGEVEPNFSWLPETIRVAATQMLANKVIIQNSVIDFITNSIIGFEYNIVKCERDTGYIIDATLYDMMYGGNKQTRRAGLAYYSGAILGAAKVGTVDQILVTAYTYYYLADLINKVAINNPVSKSYGNIATQDIGIPDGSTTAANYATLLVDRIAKSVLDSSTTGWSEVDHNYALGSAVYNNERLTILGELDSIENTAIADLNATYGGTALIRVFPGIVSVLTTQAVSLYNVSTISTSGHAFEYVGAGITYNALPFFGGSAIPANEIQELNNGKVFAGGTVDQIGNFRVGNFFAVNALTGSIELNANSISLKGLTSVGPFIRNGIPVGVELKEVSDNSNLIASTGTQDTFTAPSQKAVSTYVENRYLNKLTGGTVTGNLVLNGDFDVNGDVISTEATGAFSLLNTSATTINAFGAATSINIGSANGTVTINPDLLVEGTLTVNGDITFNGDVSLNIPDETLQAYSITTEGSLDYISINTRTDEERITFGVRPSILIENTTETSSATSGSLVVDGGVGIAKSLYVGIDFTANGSIILGSDRAIDTIDINGTTDIDLPDNLTSVLRIHENVTDYLIIDTTDTAEVVEFGSVPNVIVLNIDDAVTATSGALQVTGGISAQRNIWAGVDIFADRDIVAGRDFLVQGTNIATNEVTTFNVFNTNATEINAFGAAETITMGSITGTFTVNNNQVIVNSTGSIQIPVGTIAQRPTPITGQIRFNTDLNQYEGYGTANWNSLGGVRDVDGNTYIIPETSPGANENILSFVTDGTERMALSVDRLTLDSTVDVRFENTTASSGFSTGSFTIAGGMGIAKELHVQDYIGGDNFGVLQLTNYASDKIVIRANTIESADETKWIANAPDSSADNIVYPLTLAHHSVSGTVVAGSGTGLKFEMETANDNFETGGQIDVIAQDVTGTQEDFDMVFSTMVSGSVVEKFRIGELTATFENDVAIKGGDITTDQTTFNLLNAVATTVNFAGAGTIISIGDVTGTTTVNHNLHVTGTISTDVDLEVQYGGTGVSTFTTDGILYGNAADPLQVTDAAGTSDASVSFQILTVTSDVDATPVWTDTIDGGTF